MKVEACWLCVISVCADEREGLGWERNVIGDVAVDEDKCAPVITA